MKALALNLLPINLARFQDACFALGLNPDDVRTGEVPPDVAVDSGAAHSFVLVATGEDVPGDLLSVAAPVVAQAFFAEAFRQVAAASRTAVYYAERCGVESLLEGGERASLARVLTRFDPHSFAYLWYEASLEQAMTYLLLRTVDHLSENLEKHLSYG